MEHLGTKKLETERLILRRFTMDDAEKMFTNWTNDDEVTKYLVWQTHKDINVTMDFIKRWTQKYENNDFYDWIIILKEINEPIGSIGVAKQSDEIKMVHIGYCIGKKWWNKGITSEALNALIKFFFEEVGVNRIESRHDPNNPNSGKVMAKCGMKYEGHMRQADKNNQGICDYLMYGILAEDYFNEKNITFRKLNEGDKELFVKLRMVYLIDSYNINETEKRQIENSLKKYFDEHINKNDFIWMIGEYNGNIASVAYLVIVEKPANPNFINGKTGTIMNVYTYPEYRKRGIAKKLIQEIIKEAKTRGINSIDLMATTEEGYNLYKKLGFIDSKDKSMSIKI